MSKKGLSTVVSTLIIILLVLVAVAIFWVVVKNMVSNQSDEISLDNFEMDLVIERVFFYEESINVGVERGFGGGNLTGISFVIFDGNNSETFEQITNLGELGLEIFTLIPENLKIENIISVEIFPIFETSSGNGKIGNKLDSINTEGFEIQDSGEILLRGGGKCTPDENVCSGLSCGTAENGTCGTVSCGTCNNLQECGNNVCSLITTDLVAWWKLDGDSTDNVRNNDGSISGAILTGDGKYNQAYFFDGDHIEILDDTDFNNFDTAFSVGAWAKPTSWDLNHNTIVGQESGFLLAIDSSGKLANWLNAGGSWTKDISSNPLISLNTWTYFVITYDGVKIKSYINGELQGVGQIKTGDMGTNNKVYIGKRDDSTYQPFHGTIDEIMIFNRTLSSTEVQLLYQTDLS